MKYTYISESCFRMTGYTAEETLQLTVYDVFSPESTKVLESIIDTEFSNTYKGELNPVLPNVIFETQRYCKDRTSIWVEISARALPPDKDGVLTTLVGTTRKINDRKIAESKILEQKEELEFQQEELIQQKKQLEYLNKTKDKFFSIISHDLRNPFTSILNIAGIIKTYYFEENNLLLNIDKIKQYVDMLYQSSEQTYRLLENLLEWASNSMNTIQYNPIETDILELINTTILNLETVTNSKKISINVINNANDTIVICDNNMILTVVRNLISNSIKFSYMFSTIDINIENMLDNSAFLLISVKDSGIGMSTDTISKLFKIEEKITSTKGTNDEQGTGLGLILCKDFIDKHNCKI